MVILDPNFSKKNPAQYFTVARTLVSSLDDNREMMVQQVGPAQDAALSRILLNSKHLADKGGVGIAVMFIMVQMAGIVHLAPFELPELVTEIQVNNDWEAYLKQTVERGITV